MECSISTDLFTELFFLIFKIYLQLNVDETYFICLNSKKKNRLNITITIDFLG